jgi:hypothetical protein
VALSESDLCGGVLQGPKFRWHGYRFDHNELDPIIIASYKLAYCMTVVTSVTKVLSSFKDGANDTKSCGSHVPIVSQLVVCERHSTEKKAVNTMDFPGQIHRKRVERIYKIKDIQIQVVPEFDHYDNDRYSSKPLGLGSKNQQCKKHHGFDKY